MRIIGQLPHPFLKITVFSLNMKFAVKFEAGLMEQTYKFRESDVMKSLSDIEKLIDETFTNQVIEHFKEMNTTLGSSFKRNF